MNRVFLAVAFLYKDSFPFPSKNAFYFLFFLKWFSFFFFFLFSFLKKVENHK